MSIVSLCGSILMAGVRLAEGVWPRMLTMDTCVRHQPETTGFIDLHCPDWRGVGGDQ